MAYGFAGRGGKGTAGPAAVLVLGCLFCLAQEAWAQEPGDKDKAKEHFLKGKSLVEQGAYEKAIVELKTSYDLNPLPLVIYNIAVSYDKLHRYAAALTYYLKFLAEGGKIPAKTRSKVDERVENARNFVGLMKIEVNPYGADVRIDGEAPFLTPEGELYLDAGKHGIKITLEGHESVEEEFKVISGETLELAYTLSPVETKIEEGAGPPAGEVIIAEVKEEGEPGPALPEKPATKEKRKLGPAAFSVLISLTAVTAITGTVTGTMAYMKSMEVEDMYANEDWKPLKDETRKLAITTDVMLAVAAAGLAGSIVTGIFTDFGRKEKKGAGFMPVLAPNTAGMGFHVVY